jgi:hypothetical protein
VQEKTRRRDDERRFSLCILSIDFTQFLAVLVVDAVYIKTSVYLTLAYKTEVETEERRETRDEERKMNCHEYSKAKETISIR